MEIEMEKPVDGKSLGRDPFGWWFDTLEGLAKVIAPTPPPMVEKPPEKKKSFEERAVCKGVRLQC